MQPAAFHSFSRRTEYMTGPVDGHLCCSQHAASTAVAPCQDSWPLWAIGAGVAGCVPTGGMVGHQGLSISIFIRRWHPVLQSDSGQVLLLRVLSRSVMCDCLQPRGRSPPGCSVRGEDILFSRGSSRLSGQTHVSCVSCIDRRVFTTEPSGRPRYSRSW